MRAFAALGALEAFPPLIAALVCVSTLVFSIYRASTMLFSARELEITLAMPVRLSAIVASRVMGLYLANLPFALMVTIPAIVPYIRAAQPGALFYPIFAVCTLPRRWFPWCWPRLWARWSPLPRPASARQNTSTCCYWWRCRWARCISPSPSTPIPRPWRRWIWARWAKRCRAPFPAYIPCRNCMRGRWRGAMRWRFSAMWAFPRWYLRRLPLRWPGVPAGVHVHPFSAPFGPGATSWAP